MKRKIFIILRAAFSKCQQLIPLIILVLLTLNSSGQTNVRDTVLRLGPLAFGIPGATFELDLKKAVTIDRFIIELNSNISGQYDFDVYFRKGGVQHIPNSAPVIEAANGWEKMATALFNFNATGGRITYSELLGKCGSGISFKAGTYGFFIIGTDGGSLVSSGWLSNYDSLFTNNDSIVYVNSGPDKGYITNQIPNVYNDTSSYLFQGGVVYTPFANTPDNMGLVCVDSSYGRCLGSSPVYVTLRNYGSNRITSASINWSVDGVVQSPYLFTGLLDTIGGQNPNEMRVNIGNVVLTNPQGSAVKVWINAANGNLDSDPANDTISTIFLPAISGVYTIDPNSTSQNNFVSFTEASRILKTRGICGNLLINIAPGTYIDHIHLDELFNTTGPNSRITFDGGDTSLVELTYSSAYDTATVLLQGTDYITFKNMRISNTGSGKAWCVMMQDLAEHIEIDSCFFSLPISSIAGRTAIVASSSMSGHSLGYNTNTNHINISNSKFIGGESGIALLGGNRSSARDYVNGANIINNTFRYQDDHAIEISKARNLRISFNDADSLINIGADAVQINGATDFEISHNKIHSNDRALFVRNSNAQHSTGVKSKIYNNMVSSNTDYALYDYRNSNTSIYNNTFVGKPAIRIRFQSDVDIRNNIFYTEFAGGVVLYSDESFNAKDILDHNIYYSTGSAPTYSVGSTVYSNIFDWRLADDWLNTNSLEGDPLFIGNQDFHVLGPLADNKGDSSITVLDDIDGDLRLSSFPDIGADEIVLPLDTCQQVAGFKIDSLSATSATISFDADGKNYEIEWGPCGFTQGTAGTVNIGTSPMTITGLTKETCYDVYVRRVCSSSNNYITKLGPIRFTTPCLGPINGLLTVNTNNPLSPTNFHTVSDAVRRMYLCGINGPVTINIASGNYQNEYLDLKELNGSSSINVVTFNGADSSSTILSQDSLTQNEVVKFNGADNMIFRNLKVVSSSSGNFNQWTILITAESDNITIDNCVIIGPVTSSNNNTFAICASDVLNGLLANNGGYGDNLVIKNNIIKNGTYGLFLHGSSDNSFQDSNTVVLGNSFRGNYRGGISSLRNSNYKILNNDIVGLGEFGIRNWGGKDFEISGNKINIDDIGIAVWVSSNAEVKNNMVNSATGNGLSLAGVDKVEVIHNSISRMRFSSNTTQLDIRNNIFFADSGFAVEFQASVDPTIIMDYNNYYHSGKNKNGDLFKVGSTVYSSLPSIQAAYPGKNVHSVSGDPQFLSLTDLHASAQIVNNSGDSLNVLTDIDGDSRSIVYPDIGADEFILPCQSSSNGVATNITLNSALLSWSPGTGNTFNIQYGGTGFALGFGVQIKAETDTFFQLTAPNHALIPSTIYDFYIQDSCGTEASSGWAGPFTFTTLASAPCNASTALGVTNVSTGSADVYWAPVNSFYWNVKYGPAGFNFVTAGTTLKSLNNDTVTLTGLAGDSCYDFYVQDSCSNGILSTWVGPFNFCTSNCPTAGKDSLLNACENVPPIDLVTYIGSHSSGGSWVAPNISAALSGSTFSPSISGSGTFPVYYIVSAPGCSNDSSEVTLTIDALPNAGSDAHDTICDTILVDLTTYLGAHDPGGTWVDIDGSGGLNGSVLDLNQVSIPNTTYRYQYKLTGNGSCGSDSAIVEIYVDFCSSISTNEYDVLRDFVVYPNPSEGMLQIEFQFGSSEAIIEVSDLSGKKIRRFQINNINGTYKGVIDISDLPNGFYILRLDGNNVRSRLAKILKR